MTRIATDPSHWSESSRRSYMGMNPPAFYEDTTYQCWYCRKEAVFSAKEQKTAFELHKAYIWQRRKLCRECWDKEQKIAADICCCQAQWREQKDLLSANAEFLKNWLQLLELHPRFGARKNTAAMIMLKKRLASIS